jgi:3-dehydroquinate synthase
MSEIAAQFDRGGVVVVTDENVGPLWVQNLFYNAPILTIQAGESSKSMLTFEQICRDLAIRRVNRKSTLVAIGGGVVGDLAGFVASAYMRGIALVQVPTSLLAMVDSAVGGKVGIDLPEGKNLVGAFYPPESVWIATETLTTLPRRQFVNGLAEVLKYGFIARPEILEVVERLGEDQKPLDQLIFDCLSVKAEIVQDDEFEQSGHRAILNFGHTVGHAVEAAENYGELLHGEAVAIGMAAETRIGERVGITAPSTFIEVERRLAAAGLPTSHPLLKSPDRLIEFMRRDKKAGTGIAMSFLTGIGACKLTEDVAPTLIREVLTSL